MCSILLFNMLIKLSSIYIKWLIFFNVITECGRVSCALFWRVPVNTRTFNISSRMMLQCMQSETVQCRSTIDTCVVRSSVFWLINSTDNGNNWPVVISGSVHMCNDTVLTFTADICLTWAYLGPFRHQKHVKWCNFYILVDSL